MKAIEGQIGELNKRKEKLSSELKKLEFEQSKGETAEIASLRERYKEEKAEVTKEERDFEKQTALLDTSLKRIEDLSKSKKESERKIASLKREIDHFKQKQEELEHKVLELIGKMTAYNERISKCREVSRELNQMMEEDEREVKVSKAKIDKVRREYEGCQEGYNKKVEELKLAQN